MLVGIIPTLHAFVTGQYHIFCDIIILYAMVITTSRSKTKFMRILINSNTYLFFTYEF